MPKLEFLVTEDDGDNTRIDSFLAQKIPDLSRSSIQTVVKCQKVEVEGQVVKSSHRLKVGEKVAIEYNIDAPEKIVPEDLPLNIKFSDSDILVLDKAPGMVVHPGPGHQKHTLVNILLHHYPEISEIGPPERPGIVHRLDKETSGLMVVARSQKAYLELQRQFRARAVEKLYLGLVWGKILHQQGKITWPIGRHARHRDRISVKTKQPRDAETWYETMEVLDDMSFLEIKPITGRMHQIRVHLSAAGHPLVGDNLYGRRKGKMKCPRLFLHATQLEFFHPITQKKIQFHSPLPLELEVFLQKLRDRKTKI